MGSLKALTLAGGVALAAATAAHAADLPAPLPPPAPMAPVMEFSGWYLRGDVGLGANKNPKLRTSPDPLAGQTAGYCGGVDPVTGNQDCYSGLAGTYGFRNPTLSNSTFVDLGIGYQLNQWLRADATLEWRGGAHLQAADQMNVGGTYTQYFADGTNSGGQPYSQSLRNFYRGNVSSIVGLVNGYVDLGTFWGVTPYIGAGVGVAHNRLSGLTDQGFNYTGLNGATGAGWPTGGYFRDGKKTNFAWALMAGLSYSVTQNLKLEVGYRYMNLGKMTSGQSQCFNPDGSIGGAGCNWRVSSSKLESQDVRIGMRWMLGETAAPAPVAYFPPAAPLRSKF
jgi:opacity protein-like surface antigen